MNLVYWAIPAFIVTMVVEWRLTNRTEMLGYSGKDTAASLAMGVGNLLCSLLSGLFVVGIFYVVYPNALFEIPTDTWWVWALLIPAEDFCFYW